MNFYRYNPDIIPVDCFGKPLDADQIILINKYLDDIRNRRSSIDWFRDLWQLSRQTDKKLAQVVAHVIETGFVGGYYGDIPTGAQPEYKHLEYLEQVEAENFPNIEISNIDLQEILEIPSDDAGIIELKRQLQSWKHNLEIAKSIGDTKKEIYDLNQKIASIYSELRKRFHLDETEEEQAERLAAEIEQGIALGMTQSELEESEDGGLAFLDPELRAAVEPLSSDPAIARIQTKLRNAILDLRDAMEENEPPFILRGIEKEIAKLHEQLTRTQQRRFYRYY